MDLPPQNVTAGSIQSTESPESADNQNTEEALQSTSIWTFRRRRLGMLCGTSRLSLSRFRTAWKRQQLVTERGAVIVLSLVLCESLASIASTNYITGSFVNSLYMKEGKGGYFQTYGVALLRTYGFSYTTLLLFPFTGWLGDAKVGRHKMAVASLLILFICIVLAAFYFSFYQYLPTAGVECKLSLTFIFYFVICVGSAGFSSNIIPFGADQLLYGPAEQITSYFNWYFWTRQLGMVMLTISLGNDTADLQALIATCIASISMAAALIINMKFNKWLFIENERRNPLKEVFNVLRFVMTVKRPKRISAFGYDGRNAPSRIDLAKSKHGGKFESQTVDDVKTFLSLLPLLAMFGISIFFYLGNQSALVFQAASMFPDKPRLINHNTMQLISSLINLAIIVVFIPIMDQLIFPFLRDFTPSTLKRVGIGFASLVLASFISMLYETVNYHVSHSNYKCMFNLNTSLDNTLSVPFWMFLLPQFLLSLSRILIITSGYEFFYTQSPHRMRGMMIGLLFFSEGLIGGLLSAFQTAFITNDSNTTTEPCRIWYYLIILVINIIAFVAYVWVASKYKRRMRAGIEDSGRFYLITSR